MVPHTAMLKTQNYKLCIKDKAEKSREKSHVLFFTPVL